MSGLEKQLRDRMQAVRSPEAATPSMARQGGSSETIPRDRPQNMPSFPSNGLLPRQETKVRKEAKVGRILIFVSSYLDARCVLFVLYYNE